MVTRVYETATDVKPERLYSAIESVGTWPNWDNELECVCIEGAAIEGASFHIHPARGPKVTLLVTIAQPPKCFETIATMPLARLRMRHTFESDRACGAIIRIEIETTGPFAWFWDRLIARPLAKGLPETLQRFAAYSRARP